MNSVAWILRRFPFFVVPGSGDYGVQPVSADDPARICVEVGDAPGDVEGDAAGPDRFAFADLVRTIARAVGVQRGVVGAPALVAHALGSAIGAVRRDVLLTRDEIARYVSELARNYR